MDEPRNKPKKDTARIEWLVASKETGLCDVGLIAKTGRIVAVESAVEEEKERRRKSHFVRTVTALFVSRNRMRGSIGRNSFNLSTANSEI